MEKTLRIAASGMAAQKMYIDVIANNLANVNTTAFKKSKIEFQDLLYEKVSVGNVNEDGQSKPATLEIGNGTKPVATFRNFSQGEIVSTGNALDIAIAGDGFFQVRMPDGSFAYTRDGAFKISADGQIVTTDGYVLEPELIIPEDAEQIFISQDGRVDVKLVNDVEPLTLGQIELVKFLNPAGLEAMGQNLYRETSASGNPFVAQPGYEGMGILQQGYLENSNVDVVKEMVDMISAQRAYELNSKSIKTADDMYQVVNQLKR
ncbi:MAG: flagellar basal-body rod protein FlgG [Calditrichia bacterium]